MQSEIKSKNSTSHLLQAIQNLAAKAHEKESLSIQEILEQFGSDSHWALIAFLCLPFFQPIPLPGFSSIIALLIVTVCYLAWAGKQIHLPDFINRHSMKSGAVIKILNLVTRHWPRLHKIIRKRHVFWTSHRLTKGANFFVIVIAALLVSLPIPLPATNSIPALVIFLNSMGQIEEDGLFILASYLLMLTVPIVFAGLFLTARIFFS